MGKLYNEEQLLLKDLGSRHWI